MNLETLVEFIQSSTLDAEVKEVLVDRLMAEGLTTDTVDVLKEAFQDRIEDLFNAAGVKLDPNDPEVKEKYKQFEADMEQLRKDGEEEMKKLETDLNKDLVGVQATADKVHADQIRADFP